MQNIILTFLKELDNNDPFSGMGEKKPVYEEFFNLCRKYGYNPLVASTKNYLGNGIFLIDAKSVLAAVVYDRSGGISFPLKDDTLRVTDSREFKLLAWNKWEAYKLLSEFMPKTYELKDINKINSPQIVVKPVNGLKGQGIYIGSVEGFPAFKLNKEKTYIVQEFIDTGGGIPKIVKGTHDLRVVVINNKIVWSHVRTPPQGSQKANVATGGTLTEVDLNDLPDKVTQIVKKVSEMFYKKYDNPVFSLDFGIDKEGNSFIYEINDQIGFPKPGMKAEDRFIKELVENLISKV